MGVKHQTATAEDAHLRWKAVALPGEHGGWGLTAEPALRSYHLLPSVRGDLLRQLGRFDEARAEFERAAALTRNERERNVLLARAAACEAKSDGQKQQK